MKNSRRIIQYAKEHFDEVKHTTFNPEGPGVVRIHLVPPKVDSDEIAPSVAIINGQDIIPVDVSWTILLSEFIDEVNRYSGQEVKEEELAVILKNTFRRMRRIYPLIPKRYLLSDIRTIMKTFTEIAYREELTEDIPYMNIGEYAPHMKAPHRMDLLVSANTREGEWHCNLKCVHCYAAGQTLASEKELDTESWKRIMDKLRVIGVPQITFTGGEPTLRPDLIDLIDYGQWFVTRLNTNGILLTEEYCRRLKAASLDSLQITFYSDDETVHNRLVGAEGYQKTLEGIKNALALSMSVSINTPLCRLNKDYVSTLRFLHELGVTYVTCSGLITTGNAAEKESEEMQLSKEEISKILKDAAGFCAENAMEISFTSPGWVDDSLCEELKIMTPNCGACLSNMAVTPGGNVVPCQSWLSDQALGNLLADEWDGLWNSKACKERRDYSAKMLGTCPLRRLQGGEKA